MTKEERDLAKGCATHRPEHKSLREAQWNATGVANPLRPARWVVAPIWSWVGDVAERREPCLWQIARRTLPPSRPAKTARKAKTRAAPRREEFVEKCLQSIAIALNSAIVGGPRQGGSAWTRDGSGGSRRTRP